MVSVTLYRLGLLCLFLGSPAIQPFSQAQPVSQFAIGDPLPEETVAGILKIAAQIWQVDYEILNVEYKTGELTILQLSREEFLVTRGGGESIVVIWQE